MASEDILRVRAHLASLPPMAELELGELRAQYDKAQHVFEPPAEVAIGPEVLAGLATERHVPGGAAEATLLYFHGGGYCIGSPASHRHMIAAIAAAAGVQALAPDYRLAPEHKFPAAHEDGLACYRALLDAGLAPERILIGGDSAGGGLAVATLVAARDAGLPLPAGAILLSPWTDMSANGASRTERAEADPLVKPGDLARMRGYYLDGIAADHARASPLDADLAGLPPILIQVGADEILLDDSRQLAARARTAGVTAECQVWDDMIHVFQWFGPMLQEGRDAIDGLGRWIAGRVR